MGGGGESMSIDDSIITTRVGVGIKKFLVRYNYNSIAVWYHTWL